MDRSNVITLISQSFEKDDIGQPVPIESKREVYCNVSSIGQNEWYEAGNRGFRPELKITMFLYDYDNETVVELEGKRYAVYRTYITQKSECIELYLQEKAGV